MNAAEAKGEAWGVLSLCSADHELKCGVPRDRCCVRPCFWHKEVWSNHLLLPKGIALLFPSCFPLAAVCSAVALWWLWCLSDPSVSQLMPIKCLKWVLRLLFSSCQISEPNWLPGGDWIYLHSLPSIYRIFTLWYLWKGLEGSGIRCVLLPLSIPGVLGSLCCS